MAFHPTVVSSNRTPRRRAGPAITMRSGYARRSTTRTRSAARVVGTVVEAGSGSDNENAVACAPLGGQNVPTLALNLAEVAQRDTLRRRRANHGRHSQRRTRRLCRVAITDDGTRHLVPLNRTANLIRPNADGTYRSYVEVDVPNPRGGPSRTHRQATHGTTDDTGKSEYWRAENIRQIAPGDPDYVRLYGRRSDAESINRNLDDTLYLRRVHSIGAQRQLYGPHRVRTDGQRPRPAPPPEAPRETRHRGCLTTWAATSGLNGFAHELAGRGPRAAQRW